MNREFSKDEMQMAEKYFLKCSRSFIKEMLIRITLKFPLTLFGMAKIQNTNSKKCRSGCCWWQCKLIQQLWKPLWRFLKRLEIDAACGPAIPHWAPTQKALYHSTEIPVHSCSLPPFSESSEIGNKWCPSTDGEWRCGTQAEWNVTQLLKNKITKFTGKWMKLETIILSELT